MATTSSSALSQALRTTVQRKVLENLRAELVYANPALAAQGEFDSGSDTIRFLTVPDLALSTTVLTEGTPPTAQALSLTTTTLSTTQYGETVEITDVAKVKSPIDLVDIATERLSRQAAESIDQIIRDVAASGGTPFYPIGSANTIRSEIASGENATGAALIRLRAKMRKSKVPPMADGKYRLMLSVAQAYDLKSDTTDDTGWLDVSKYTDNSDIMRGEIGTLHGFRISEVVNAPTFSSTVTVNAALATGRLKGWGVGDLQTLSTHHVTPGGDHTDPLAQKEIIGYKVNFGAAVLKNSYYFRYETDATAI